MSVGFEFVSRLCGCSGSDFHLAVWNNLLFLYFFSSFFFLSLSPRPFTKTDVRDFGGVLEINLSTSSASL